MQSAQFDEFNHLEMGSFDPIFEIFMMYLKDKDPKAVNLTIGAYRDNAGQPLVFSSVKKAEQLVIEEQKNKEYLPIDGYPEFKKGAAKLIFGEESKDVLNGNVASCQTFAGTGALSLGLTFLSRERPGIVYVTTPTWANHRNLIEHQGLKMRSMRYYDDATKAIDFEGFMEDLRNTAFGSIVLLQANAHNPTGVDPSEDQWKQMLEVFHERKLYPFFDVAYQGFRTGDVDKDIQPVRLFAESGLQVMVAQSFSKIMGLYGERIGCLHIRCTTQEIAEKVKMRLVVQIRGLYSSPSRHGGQLVMKILGDEQLKAEWKQELKEISERIVAMRVQLRDHLVRLGAKGDWNHITDQIGMFTYTGLSRNVCERLRNEKHVYMLNDGRISVSGLNESNVEYTAQSIKEVLETEQ